jgi:RNA polymerase sigma-70 factor (ECF subfamily)
MARRQLRGKTRPVVEHSLVGTANRDQHDEFLRLFMAHEAALRGFLRSLLFSHEEVRDVLQNTAVVLWRKYEPGMSPDAFVRWAFGVARMETLVFRRDRARDRHVFSEDVQELLEQAAAARPAPPDDRRDALDACLQKLSPDNLRLVMASYAPDARIDKVAQSIGRTAMAVYKSLHRIRIALAECIRKTMIGYETGERLK